MDFMTKNNDYEITISDLGLEGTDYRTAIFHLLLAEFIENSKEYVKQLPNAEDMTEEFDSFDLWRDDETQVKILLEHRKNIDSLFLAVKNDLRNLYETYRYNKI